MHRFIAAVFVVPLMVGTLGGCKQYDPVSIEESGELADGDPLYWEDDTPYDEYIIEANSGMQLSVEMFSEEFDAFVLVLDSDGDLVAQDDDGGGGTDARLTWRVQWSGRYRVLANCYRPSDRGYYEINIRTTRG